MPSLLAAFGEGGKGCLLFAAWSFSLQERSGAQIARDMRALKRVCFYLAATQLQHDSPQAQQLVRTGLVLDYAGRSFERARPAATQRTGRPLDPVLAQPLVFWNRLSDWARKVSRKTAPPRTRAAAEELEAAIWLSLGSGLLSGSRFTTLISTLQLSSTEGCQLAWCRFRQCPGNRVLLPEPGAERSDEVHVVLPHHKTAESRQFRPIEFRMSDTALVKLLRMWESKGRQVGGGLAAAAAAGRLGVLTAQSYLLQVLYGAAAASSSSLLFLHHDSLEPLLCTGTHAANQLERYGRRFLGVEGLRPRALRRHWASLVHTLDPHNTKGIKSLVAKAMGTSVKMMNER